MKERSLLIGQLRFKMDSLKYKMENRYCSTNSQGRYLYHL